MSLYWSLSQSAWLSHDEKSSNPFNNRLSNQVDMKIYDTVCKKISCSISLLLVSQFYKHRTVRGSDQVWAEQCIPPSRPLPQLAAGDVGVEQLQRCRGLHRCPPAPPPRHPGHRAAVPQAEVPRQSLVKPSQPGPGHTRRCPLVQGELHRAVDVGCGSGMSTRNLVGRFRHVLGQCRCWSTGLRH